MKKLYPTLLGGLVLSLNLTTHGQFLDTSFDNDGMALLNYGSSFEEAADLQLQNDGKIVVVGHDSESNTTYGFVSRLMPDGTPDTDFGEQGVFRYGIEDESTQFYDVMIDNEGRILVAGITYDIDALNRAVVMRLLSDGTLDDSFSNDGIATFADLMDNSGAIFSLAMQSDGRVIAGGEFYSGSEPELDLMVLRLEEDGTVDMEFGVGGLFIADLDSHQDHIYGITIDSNDNIIYAGEAQVSGTQFMVGKLLPDGAPDLSFAGGAVYYLDAGGGYGRHVIMAADGDIIAAGFQTLGTGNQDIFLVRLNPDGTLNTDFAGTGYMYHEISSDITAISTSVVELADGSLLVASQHTASNEYGEVMLTRYSADGIWDETFGEDGLILTDGLEVSGDTESGMGLAVQPDGKVLVSGRSNATGNGDGIVLRFYGDQVEGISDRAESSLLVYPNPAEDRVSFSQAIQAYTLYDISGRVVQNGNINGSGVLDLAGIVGGSYFLTTTSAMGVLHTTNLVITRD